jgi:hypothetical protein
VAEPLADRAPSLPHPRTPLVGRTVELASARALLLDEAVPLVTLTGPGGVGTTVLVASFADAVFVALSRRASIRSAKGRSSQVVILLAFSQSA